MQQFSELSARGPVVDLDGRETSPDEVSEQATTGGSNFVPLVPFFGSKCLA
jgi:hypothetical protein